MESPARGESFCQKVIAMSGINGVGGNSPVQKIVSNPIQKSIPADAPKSTGATDKVKVADIKAQIEAGTNEDDAKMDVAVDRMLDDLMK
jgi:hypothetical protein